MSIRVWASQPYNYVSNCLREFLDIVPSVDTVFTFYLCRRSLCRKLEDGDIVNVDVSVYYKGVHADLNETYFVGNVDEESCQLVKCTYECLEKAISIVKPGVRFREIGEVISRHASMSGFSVARSYCGHGIGELFHCAPNIPHYARNKAVGVMKAGQTFTIEPMINAGVWRDRMWPDGWTDVTTDGKRSAQFEHTLLELASFLFRSNDFQENECSTLFMEVAPESEKKDVENECSVLMDTHCDWSLNIDAQSKRHKDRRKPSEKEISMTER
ncbi:hypothetical protein V8G54_009219 [Vigna mungo]|uniref:Methionine aminopeptidase n=1 Tax=Vigna mungo TaxID=3915 RepID=A0AAQ3NWS5_VIGMU